MAGIVDKPNKVIEYQKFFQSETSTPIWLRGGVARKSFVYLFFGGLAVGIFGAANSYVKMARGKK